jgi:hypothetical protein
VRCIPKSWTSSDLEKLFADAGAELAHPVKLPDFETKAKKVFTLVETRTPEDQQKALGIVHVSTSSLCCGRLDLTSFGRRLRLLLL